MAPDLDIRLVRHFIAVAEELHFGLAARRLFIAQQAVSRDVARLEERIGRKLLDRSTRRVTLTAAGERFLAQARRLVALHDEMLRDARDGDVPLVVDIVGAGLTPAVVLAAARAAAPEVEFFARFGPALDVSVAGLTAYSMDVAFGRLSGPPTARLAHRPVRQEPLALLMLPDHPLAQLPEVPAAALRGRDVCTSTGDHATPEWADAARRFLAHVGARPSDAHEVMRGPDEVLHHLRLRGIAALAMSTQRDIPGTVRRPIADPVPLLAWSMLWREDFEHPGLDALHAAVDVLAAQEGWLAVPPGALTL